jgi:hypothetical protein
MVALTLLSRTMHEERGLPDLKIFAVSGFCCKTPGIRNYNRRKWDGVGWVF